MPKKYIKDPRTKRLTLSLSEQEKSFIRAFRTKFNEKYDTKLSYGEVFLLLCNEEATKEKIKPVLKQLSIFDQCAAESNG